MSSQPVMTPDTHERAKRYATNKLNAVLSTGPKTAAGKAISAQNALKHGLTAISPLLPTEDKAAYDQHVRGFEEDYQPKTATERQLTRDLADTSWRMNRLPALEASIIALEALPPGSISTDIPDLDACLAVTETLRRQERALDTLSKHHTRLSRHFHKTLNELRGIQSQRRKEALDDLDRAATRYLSFKMRHMDYDPASDGFVFSKEQVEAHYKHQHRMCTIDAFASREIAARR